MTRKELWKLLDEYRGIDLEIIRCKAMDTAWWLKDYAIVLQGKYQAPHIEIHRFMTDEYHNRTEQQEKVLKKYQKWHLQWKNKQKLIY